MATKKAAKKKSSHQEKFGKEVFVKEEVNPEIFSFCRKER